ncbi:EamA family transporter [Candidatus Woesearchaeota archaeon]|nr:EamA family transporter [Candidatus Woesearchaeota archaeon]
MTSVTKAWAFGLVLLTTLLTTTAQFFLKTATARFPDIFTNWPLLIGIAIYAIGSGIMILAFKGGEVSVLYPVIATSYVWVALIAHFYLGESVHLLRWIGIFTIVLGITFVGFGGKRHTGIEHAGVA